MCPACKEIRNVYYCSLKKAGHCFCLKCINKIQKSKHIDPGTVYNKLTILKESQRPGYSICKCECGTVKEIYNYNITTGKTKSCGCLRKQNFINTKKVKGKEHGNWKGGISDLRDRFMQSEGYKNWRSAVFKRDNYTCKKCGQIGYELNAHHIYNYSDYIDLRVEVNNGITLCKKCHIQFHKEYGRKNDIDQINSFLILKIRGPLRNYMTESTIEPKEIQIRKVIGGVAKLLCHWNITSEERVCEESEPQLMYVYDETKISWALPYSYVVGESTVTLDSLVSVEAYLKKNEDEILSYAKATKLNV